jgi:hypothetical protein
MEDMFDHEKLRLRAGELVNQVGEEAAGRASPAEQVRFRGVAYDLAARLFISGRIAARPQLEVLERIISDGIERGDPARTIARAVLDLVEGPKWKGRRHGPAATAGTKRRSPDLRITSMSPACQLSAQIT